MCGCVLQPFFCLCFKEGLTISKNDLQINEQIRDNEIRVVSADGEQLGVMSAKEAQDIAYEKGMDLVKIAPQAKPPVCKIMDYGKYKFELNKREKENRKRLIDLLNSYVFLKVIGDSAKANYVGIVSCVIDGISSDTAGQLFAERKIAVRTGLHCAPLAHKFIGTFPAGTIRFSTSFFTTDEDFEELRQVLDDIDDNL